MVVWPLEPQQTKLRKGVDVIVATPGRLLDHMERQNVVFDDLEVLVLDEADRMLDMGFAPQLNRIVAEVPRFRQTLLFSATMPPEVEALARKYLRKPIVVQVGRRSAAANTVTHAVYPVPRDRKTELLAELLKKEELDSVLIFTRTKHGADRVVRHLGGKGIARRRCTRTDRRASARARSRISRAERCGCSSQPTSRSAASMYRNNARHQLRRAATAGGLRPSHRENGRAAATGDAFTFMAPDEIAMVRTIERVIGQQIPRISVPGYDFGSVAAVEEPTPGAGEIPAAEQPELPAKKPAARQLRRPNAVRGRGARRR